MPAIDFSSVKGLEPVDPGTYTAAIVYAQEGSSKNKQPKIDVRWKIEGGPFDGRQVFDSLSFHPDALWRTKLTLQALGFPENFNGDIVAEDLINLRAVIVVGMEANSENIDPETNEPYPARNRVTRVKSMGRSAKSLLE